MRGVAFLKAEDLQAVLVRCAQCNMTAEVSSLAARTVADGTGASAENSALVAALVDDANLAQKNPSIFRCSMLDNFFAVTMPCCI